MIRDNTYSGGCHCGAVRFEATGNSIESAICHCRSCQQTIGAESVGWAMFSSAAVEWSGAQRSFYVSSQGVERSFCGQCGCSLTYQNVEHTIDIILACLDDPESLTPNKEIWLDHRISWNALNSDLPAYRGFSDTE